MDLVSQFDGWSPVRLYRRDGELWADWCRLDGVKFVDPFYTETIDRAMRRPFNLTFRQQTLAPLMSELIAAGREHVEPTGFIFHISRCGSTLVSQMLGAADETCVLSEPPQIDALLRAKDVDRAALLKGLIGCLGDPRFGSKRLFIKFDGWSIFDFDVIREAYPNVPWVFLFRDPVEVIVSQMRRRSIHMIPGSTCHVLPGYDLGEIITMPAEEYVARVIARFCEAAIENADSGRGIFVDYSELPEAVTARIASHFDAKFDAAELASISAAATRDAKSPNKQFAADVKAKQQEASDAARTAAEKFVTPYYEKLLELSKR